MPQTYKENMAVDEKKNGNIQEIYRHETVVSANKLYFDAVCITLVYIHVCGVDAAC